MCTGILICDVLFVTTAIFTAVIDVFLGIEIADAGTRRIKIANFCRFYCKTASSKKTSARPKKKFKLEFERHGVNVELAYMTFTVRDICAFAIHDLSCRLTRVYEGHFLLCYKEEILVDLSR